MPTVPSKKQRKRLIQLLDDLMWLFSVQNMERAVSFKENQKGIRLAEVEIEENYQRLTIDIYPLFWDSSLKDQRKTIIHEFIHVWFEPLRREANMMLEGKYSHNDRVIDATERGVSSVENILDGLLSGRFKYAREGYKDYLK